MDRKYLDNQQIQYKDQNNWKVGTIIKHLGSENSYMIKSETDELKMKEEEIRSYIPLSPRKLKTPRVVKKKLTKPIEKNGSERKGKMFGKIKKVLHKSKDLNNSSSLTSESDEEDVEHVEDNSVFPGIKLRKNILQIQEHQKLKEDVFVNEKPYDEDLHHQIFLEVKKKKIYLIKKNFKGAYQ